MAEGLILCDSRSCQGDIGKNHNTGKFYILHVARFPHLDHLTHSGLFLEIHVWGRKPGTANQLRNRDCTLSSDWLMPVKVYRQWEGNHSLSSLSVWGWVISPVLVTRHPCCLLWEQRLLLKPSVLGPVLWIHSELVHAHQRHLSTTTNRKTLHKRTGSTWHQGLCFQRNSELELWAWFYNTS